jgi:hypothetical protein
MGLARIDDLQAAGRGGDLRQPFWIGEEQRGALVGGHAARESQGEHIGIEHQAGASGHLAEQIALGAGVGGENLLLRQVDGIAQVEVVAAPGGEVASSIR